MKLASKIRMLKYRIKKYLFPTKITSSEFVYYLESKGLNIGKGTHFFDPSRTIVDVQRPWMLSIGEYCKITSNCTILSHDYSYSVLRRSHNEIMGGARTTSIGNNVFLGIGSIVSMGAQIGDNVIIGAGSVVTGIIPSNTVAAGNPARVICPLDEFYHKRKNRQVDEAKEYISCFYRKYQRYPTEKQMELFFSLFLPREEGILKEKKVRTNLSGDEQEEVIETFYQTRPDYSGLEQLINEI